jgi:excisionase family DNA binding protein
MEETMEHQYLTAEQAAGLLNVSPAYVRKLVDSGDIPGEWEVETGECCIPRSAVIQFKDKMAAQQA